MVKGAQTHMSTMRPVPSLRASVEWREGDRTLSEDTRLLGVTQRGATLELSEPPSPGHLVRLVLPTAGNSSVSLWALVWGIAGAQTAGRQTFTVSLLFFGTDIASNFAENPEAGYAYVAEDGGLFRLQSYPSGGLAGTPWSERRRDSRLHLPVEVTTELLDEGGGVAARELAITENISRGGAALRTALPAPLDSRVRLTCERYKVVLDSVVRACNVGPDNITRMHVEFIDGQWPIDG